MIHDSFHTSAPDNCTLMSLVSTSYSQCVQYLQCRLTIQSDVYSHEKQTSTTPTPTIKTCTALFAGSRKLKKSFWLAKYTKTVFIF